MEEGYLGDNDILYTAKIAKNIHDNLVENGVAVRSFIMDGMSYCLIKSCEHCNSFNEVVL